MLMGGEHQAFGVLVEVAREELGWVYCVLMALSAKLLSTLATRNLRRAISLLPRPCYLDVVVFLPPADPDRGDWGSGLGDRPWVLSTRMEAAKAAIDKIASILKHDFC